MTDVFFLGYGHWVNEDYDPEEPQYYVAALNATKNITGIFQVNGVFSLNKSDEITYKHTKSFDHVNSLLPSTHSDDQFSTLLANDVIEGLSEMYPNFIFVIDPSRPREALVLATPDKQPNHLKTELTENERDTLLKLILCMAIDSYGHDPASKKNPSTGKNNGSIKAALEKHGLSADEKTISKYLKEAAERYPDAKPVKPKT